MRVLVWLDGFCLSVIRRIAHAIQYLTGVISYQIAANLFCLSTAIIGIDFLGYWWPAFDTNGSASFGSTFIDALAIMTFTLLARRAYQAAREWGGDTIPRVARMFMGTDCVRSALMLMQLVALGLYVGDLQWPSLSTGVLCSLNLGSYFMGVAPLPPSAQRHLVESHASI